LKKCNLRKQCTQTFLETGYFRDILFRLAAVDDGFDAGIPAPQIWAAQRADSRHFH
jgi:hypothetical protein